MSFSHKLLTTILFVAIAPHSFSQVMLDSSVTSASIDFESTVNGIGSGLFQGAGFSPMPLDGQLDSDAFSIKGFSDGDLLFGATAVSGDLARGAISGGGTSTGGLYALADFPGPGGQSVAFQPGGTDFTPGSITLRIVNNDPEQLIVSLTVSYDIYELNDQGRSSYLYFSYSGDDVTYTPLPALDHFTAEPADASPEFVKVGGPGPSRSVTIAPVSVGPNGGQIFLRWESDDFSGTGSRDEIALDNISVTAKFLGTTAAEGTIEGAAVSEAGAPLGFVFVTLTGEGIDPLLFALTNPFGRFRFEGLPVGRTYLLGASAGRYSFKNPLIPVTLDSELQTVMFEGRSREESAGRRK